MLALLYCVQTLINFCVRVLCLYDRLGWSTVLYNLHVLEGGEALIHEPSMIRDEVADEEEEQAADAQHDPIHHLQLLRVDEGMPRRRLRHESVDALDDLEDEDSGNEE